MAGFQPAGQAESWLGSDSGFELETRVPRQRRLSLGWCPTPGLGVEAPRGRGTLSPRCRPVVGGGVEGVGPSPWLGDSGPAGGAELAAARQPPGRWRSGRGRGQRAGGGGGAALRPARGPGEAAAAAATAGAEEAERRRLAAGAAAAPGGLGRRWPSAQAAARGARHAGAGLRRGEPGPRRAAAAPACGPAAARRGPDERRPRPPAQPGNVRQDRESR